MYKLILDEEVIKILKKLPIRKRIFEKLVKTKEDPFRYFIKLKNREDYKLRIGKYRIIADIKDNKIIITYMLQSQLILKKLSSKCSGKSRYDNQKGVTKSKI